MKKTNFTIHSLTRATATCCLTLLLTVFSFIATIHAQTPNPCPMTCIGKVNVSMPSQANNCNRIVCPSDFTTYPLYTCVQSIHISYPFGTVPPNNNDGLCVTLNRSQLGYTFIYSLYDGPNATGNSCWGYMTLEDKAGPDLMCFNRKASCALIESLTSALGVVTDNCAGQTPAILKSLTYVTWGDGCTDPRGIGQVYRQIQGYDVWGNTSSCNDTITIIRNQLSDVHCPTLLSLACKSTCGITTITWDRYAPKDRAFDNTLTSQVLYPTPANLVALKAVPCVFAAGDTVVPYICDSVYLDLNGIPLQVPTVKCTNFWKSTAGICKLIIGWTDEVYELCPGGDNAFKIRRQWRITNWCTGKDTLCIQYIKVEDKQKPNVDAVSSKDYYASPHDCNAAVDLPAPGYKDCSKANQTYTIQYTDLSGKLKVLTGTLPATVYLPAPPYFDKCYDVVVRTTDLCLNDSITHYSRCVFDITPPTPVCDEFTVTTVDPATCWARVYAKDLDNGSRDNCCNVLHFAVADMDSIDKATKSWVDYWTANCFSDYWKYKSLYDKFLSDYINCFVFKDYLDLTECGDHRVVLRVYEACGVPRYDPHVFPCSEHDWYTYNTIKLCRAWHNYTFFAPKGAHSCTAKPKNWCQADWTAWFTKANTEAVNPYGDNYGGLGGYNLNAGDPIYNTFYIGGTDGFAIDYNLDCIFYFPQTAENGTHAPGNRCSSFLYNDCMVNVHVDDKTPPVCEGIHDLFYYCDGVNEVRDLNTQEGVDYELEYANRACDKDNTPFPDYTCRVDYNNSSSSPYKDIELTKEDQDDAKSDWFDPTGKYYGYYGCAEGVSGHPIDEHTQQISGCDINEPSGHYGKYSNGWAPVYCHTWLTLDATDNPGKKTTPKFWTPEVRSGGPKGSASSVVVSGAGGEFQIWDNCWIGTPTYKDASYIDQCGNGWLSRTWSVGDKCGATVISCTQKIYTKHRSDFEVMFPADVVAVCGSDENLSPDVTGRPMVMDDECELVGVNYSDVRYDIIADACFKIVRTWTLIDWCKYDPNALTRYPEVIVDDRAVASAARYCVFTKLKDDGDGYMTYTQIIKVKDTVPPVVTCHSDTVCITTGYGGFGDEIDCSVPGYSQVFVATDNCTPANKIEFRYEIYKGSTLIRKSPPKVTGFTAIAGDLTTGVNTLVIIASDKCGQEDTTSCTVTVKDCKKPTPYCYDGIATVVMPSSGEVTVWATDLNAGSYDNCTKKGKLKFSFDAAGLQASKVFKCADAKPGQATMYVWDEAGNSDFCTVSLSIQSNDPACQPAAGAAGAIAGKIATESTEPVENVILDAKTSTFKTDSKGTYAFTGLTTKQDYTITPKRDDDPTNGVSTIDLVLIQKHILGVQPLNSAYKVIAADVDRSNDVSAVDLVELRKLILTVYDKLPNNTSWRFVPKAYNFSNIANPWGFPEKIDITGLTKDELNRDFVGVKIGDVNGTVVPHSLLGAESRDAGTSLKFTTSDRQLKAGEEATVEFTAENFNNIEGYQFSLAVKGLELKAVNSGVLKVSEGNFGMTKLGEGYVTTSWNDSKGITATGSEVLFSIKVKATKALTLSEALVINSKYTRAEAYNGGSNLGVVLEVGTKSVSGYALHQNTPNPFKATTVISYNLAKNDKVTLKITDVTGRVVRVYTESGVKGYNQKTISRTDVSGAGVLYYTIETKDYSATKKMILVD